MTGISQITRARAKELRRDPTPQQRLVWGKLRDINRMLGTHFRRQAPIGPHIADFADYGRRIVVEIEGGLDGGPESAARDNWLKGQGFRLLRFRNSDVSGNLDRVAQAVLDVLEVGNGV